MRHRRAGWGGDAVREGQDEDEHRKFVTGELGLRVGCNTCVNGCPLMFIFITIMVS